MSAEANGSLDPFEYHLGWKESEIDSVRLDQLASLVHQAADEAMERARNCRGTPDEFTYRAEAAAVYRAARIIRALHEKGGAL